MKKKIKIKVPKAETAKRRGRPPGSKNKVKTEGPPKGFTQTAKRTYTRRSPKAMLSRFDAIMADIARLVEKAVEVRVDEAFSRVLDQTQARAYPHGNE